jgi:hypothetical protein
LFQKYLNIPALLVYNRHNLKNQKFNVFERRRIGRLRQMTYKPKYCCQCGDRIERTKWTPVSSTRFCQVCESDFALREWIPRVVFVVVSIFGIVGLFGYFQTTEKPLKITATRSVEQNAEAKRNFVNRSSNEKSTADAAAAVVPQNAANTGAAMPHQIAVSAKPSASPKKRENQPNVDESTYFCGAETKKGAPCSRRVKGGGRCWQHAGQPAILPAEKLSVSR